MEPRFAGLTALVTGGGHGIGRATAQRLAAEAASVVVADLELADARAAVTDLPVAPGRPHRATALDVTRTPSVDEAMAAVADRAGGLDVLVHTVGGDMHHGPFETTGDEVWERMFQLNLLGAVRVCRAALPLLRRAAGGRAAVVLVGSVNAVHALGAEPYSAAKAGLASLVGNLAVQLGPEQIRVNAVVPGTIRTRVWDDQPGGADSMVGFYPLGRVGEPVDVANAIAFLASSDAAWVTGHCLPVDGGLGAR